ncbi:MAG: hypothetical protein QM775_02430 [Pirellulales bacterium]
MLTDVAKDIAAVERRQVAAFPAWETRTRWGLALPRKQSLVAFPKSFEAWFDDHIGLRRPLIQTYQLAKVYGLTVDRQVVGENQALVTVGRDGWLFLTGGLLDDFRRTAAFRPEDLAAWRSCFVERSAWSRSRGIEYVVLAAPTAQTIYPEFMPRNLKRADRPSRLDELAAAMSQTPDVKFVDPCAVLVDERHRHPTYLKTDGYWNDFGALLAYEQTMARMPTSLMIGRRAALADFEVRIEPVVDQGNLAKLLNSPVPFREDWLTLLPRTPRQAKSEVVGATSDGRTITRWTCESASGGCLVVLHDSFFKRIMPLVGEQFREVYYVPGLEFPLAEIERWQPDAIIQQFVESKLMSRPPTNPAAMSTEVLTAAEPPATSPPLKNSLSVVLISKLGSRLIVCCAMCCDGAAGPR